MFDIERNTLLKSVQLDREVEGPVSDLFCVDHLIYALTSNSSVFCYDLRIAPKKGRNAIELSSVWQRRIKNSYGLITSFCVDSINQHWMLLTASSATTKNMLLWDLRFAGLEVSNWSHPSEQIIPLRSWALPNGSVWNLSTQSNGCALSKLLSHTKQKWSPQLWSLNVIFTGDSEDSLRCCNLRHPNASAYLCSPYRRHLPSGDLNIGDLQVCSCLECVCYKYYVIKRMWKNAT